MKPRPPSARVRPYCERCDRFGVWRLTGDPHGVLAALADEHRRTRHPEPPTPEAEAA